MAAKIRYFFKKAGKKRKSKDSKAILAKLEEYLQENTSEPMLMLARIWDDQQKAITYKEIRNAILNGDITEELFKLWQQDYSVFVVNSMAPIWSDSVKAGSLSQPLMQKAIERSVEGFTFNLHSDAINNWISSKGASFVTNITEAQRDAIRALIYEYETGLYTSDELAKVIRPCIGLDRQQARANLRHYQSVKQQLKQEHPRMSAENIQRKAQESAARYAERQHRFRADTITQSEIATAYNKGSDEAIRQAIEQNLIGLVEKRWSSSGDGNVCKICVALDGTQIGLEGSFDFKGKELYPGHKMTPPAHPRCACAVMYIEIVPPI